MLWGVAVLGIDLANLIWSGHGQQFLSHPTILLPAHCPAV
jgi:hypothetical protein